MAKYSVECPACNKSYTVQLYGPGRDREYKLNNWDWTCDACREKQRQEENAKAAAENAAAGLPALTGTEKQIAWAETLRVERLGVIRKALAGEYDYSYMSAFWGNSIGYTDEKCLQPEDPRTAHAIEVLRRQASARWWIDQRETKVGIVLTALFASHPPVKEDPPEIREAKEEVLAEATVRPEQPKTETVAEIRVGEKSVEVSFPEKREDFWQIIKKGLGYTWSGSSWKRSLGVTHGTPADRAAEAGNKLLAAGFIIRILDPAIRQAAIDATFEPEHTRWISKIIAGEYPGWFSITWKEDSRSLYDAARKLKRSKYSKPAVVVPAEQFEAVLDFAGMYGFRLSPGAQALVDMARTAKESALVAAPVPAKKEALPEPGSKPACLNVPENVEVDDEFKD
ncbi:MAG: hypothetical protein GXY24_03680 [Bacteroidales bacterium]|nr:hypothetical protein [Bacteroidales bacterium]